MIVKRILISRAHDYRYQGDGWDWVDGVLKKRGYNKRTCVDCGRVEELPHGKTKTPCRRKGESITSGYSGVVVEHSQDGNVKIVGRHRMAGKHPVTGRAYAQWYWSPQNDRP